MTQRPFGRLVAVCLLGLAGLVGPLRAAVPPPADCPPAPAAPDAAGMAELARHAQDRGFLWRLTRDGRVSYLYGTLHVGRRAWVVPGRTVLAALRSTTDIALEMDMADPEIGTRLGQAIKPDDAAPLPAPLTARLAAAATAACLPESVTAQFSPEMLAMTLAVVAGRRDGLEPAYGADIMLSGMGRDLHHPVHSLETPEAQVAVIKGGDPAETREAVARALDEIESGRTRAQLRRIADIWSEGRLDELSHYADWCGCLDSDAERALMRRALDDRNPGLADGIAALHDAGRTVFAAVGSLHMIGPDGLPALLRQRGFAVERVPFTR